MKQAQNARKQRGRAPQRKGGRSNNNSGGGNRSENKVRGNPKQLLEKYKNQARDALQAGDRVTAEYYFQFADHYQRVLNEIQGPAKEQSEDGEEKQQGRRGRRNNKRRNDDDAQPAAEAQAEENSSEETPAESADAGATADAVETDPANAEQPKEVHPELDLGEAEEKPKRKAPVRRRRPAKPKAEAPAADAGAAPEDDAAA